MHAVYLAFLPLWFAAANPLIQRTDANACTRASGGCPGVSPHPLKQNQNTQMELLILITGMRYIRHW